MMRPASKSTSARVSEPASACPSPAKQWSRTMTSCGLSFRRNVPGKWNYGCDIAPPIRLSSKAGLRYLFARQPDELLRDFDWRDDTAAIATGRRYLRWGLDIFDQCLRDTAEQT